VAESWRFPPRQQADDEFVELQFASSASVVRRSLRFSLSFRSLIPSPCGAARAVLSGVAPSARMCSPINIPQRTGNRPTLLSALSSGISSFARASIAHHRCGRCSGFRKARERGTIGGSELAEPRKKELTMTLKIGDIAPDFEVETTEGRIHFHDWIGDSWTVLFSHPKDFTPVCTTELGYMARIKPEFDRRNVKIIGLSVDPVDSHSKWANDIRETQGFAVNYPMIGDPDLAVSKLYGMLPASASGDPAKRTPADNQTVRNVFVIGPDKKIKLILVYPMTTGRNFDEVLRVIDSLQLTAKHKVATPVNWKQGEDVIIAGSVSDDEAKKTYPQGWKAPRPYIRIVPQPRS